MKCISDEAIAKIIRVSDAEAAWLVKEKPHRYSYVNKEAWKSEKIFLSENAKRTTPIKRVIKSRKGRRSHGELR